MTHLLLHFSLFSIFEHLPFHAICQTILANATNMLFVKSCNCQKTVIEVCKRVTYIDWVKKDLFGCFRIEEIRDKDNETGLKEEGVI